MHCSRIVDVEEGGLIIEVSTVDEYCLLVEDDEDDKEEDIEDDKEDDKEDDEFSAFNKSASVLDGFLVHFWPRLVNSILADCSA